MTNHEDTMIYPVSRKVGMLCIVELKTECNELQIVETLYLMENGVETEKFCV